VIDPAAIVASARALVGTPYRHQCRLPGVFLDCVGVPVVVAREHGIVAPDFDITGYPNIGDGALLMASCDKYLIRVAEPEIGGVAIFSSGAEAHHMGIVVPYRHGGLAIVHARGFGSQGKVVESRILPRMKLVAAYRFPGVAA
jgi:cell wall-associated NlpC family hydrolase